MADPLTRRPTVRRSAVRGHIVWHPSPAACRGIQRVKIVHNVCGWACIFGLTSPNNQVSINTKERSARYHGDPPLGNIRHHGAGVLKVETRGAAPSIHPNPGGGDSVSEAMQTNSNGWHSQRQLPYQTRFCWNSVGQTNVLWAAQG